MTGATSAGDSGYGGRGGGGGGGGVGRMGGGGGGSGYSVVGSGYSVVSGGGSGYSIAADDGGNLQSPGWGSEHVTRSSSRSPVLSSRERDRGRAGRAYPATLYSYSMYIESYIWVAGLHFHMSVSLVCYTHNYSIYVHWYRLTHGFRRSALVR